MTWRLWASTMRLPDSAHTSKDWRIHEVARGFRLEDVWALPAYGGPDDFARLVRGLGSIDSSRSTSNAVRVLFAIRWMIGGWFGWDRPDAGARSWPPPTLRERLPADLARGPAGPDLGGRLFTSLYLLDDEWAAEIVNRTVHGVAHIGWAPDGDGRHRGQLAVLVKPNGLLGAVYLAAIRPLRHLVVYPRLLRDIERQWQAAARL